MFYYIYQKSIESIISLDNVIPLKSFLNQKLSGKNEFDLINS